MTKKLYGSGGSPRRQNMDSWGERLKLGLFGSGLPVFFLPIERKLPPPGSPARDQFFKFFMLVLTFFCYTSYHLSRKPISVVKGVLRQENCTGCTSNTSCMKNCSWAPFGDENGKSLLGTLDYGYLFAYAIAMFFSGHICERMNLRIFLSIGMIFSGLFTIAFGLGKWLDVHEVYGFYLPIQIVGGMFQSTGWPAVVAAVGNWFGKGKRGLIFGIWNSHTSVGNILGSVIASAFVDSDWGLSFLVPGAIICGIGVIVFFTLAPSPLDVGCTLPDHGDSDQRHPIVPSRSVWVPQTSTMEGAALEEDEEENSPSDEEIEARSRKSVQSQVYTAMTEGAPLLDDSGNANSTQPQQSAISVFGALKIPGVIEFSLCLFFAKLVSYTFLFWLPTIIQSNGSFSAELSGYLSTLFDVGGILGGILAGHLSDLSSSPGIVCVGMLVLGVPMLFLYDYFSTSTVFINIVLLLGLGFLVNGPYALITTAVSADLGTHKSLAGSNKALATVTAIIDGTGSMGAALGPFIAGLVPFEVLFYTLMGCDVLAAVLLLRIVHREFTQLLALRRSRQTLRNTPSA